MRNTNLAISCFILSLIVQVSHAQKAGDGEALAHVRSEYADHNSADQDALNLSLTPISNTI